MATAKKTTAKPAAKTEAKPAEEPQEPAAGSADQGVTRGGWDVGYRGDRVDDVPNEAYTVTGVLKGAQSEK